MTDFSYRLTQSEMSYAVEMAKLRHAINTKKKHVNRNCFAHDDGLHAHVVGCISELGASKILSLPWNAPCSKNVVPAPDVGPYYVKGTERGGGHLLVRERDLACPPGPYVLAIVDGSRVHLMGWLQSERVKVVGVWCKRKPEFPAWWVAQVDLEPMTTLTQHQPAVKECT